MRLVHATAIALLLAAPGIAQAEEAAAFPEDLFGMLGQWSLADQDGEGRCVLTLTSFTGIGGYEVSVPETCAQAPASEIATWRIDEENGAVILSDALRQPVLTLAEMGDGGIFGTQNEGEEQYYLYPWSGVHDDNEVAVSDGFDGAAPTPAQLREIVQIAYDALADYGLASAGQTAGDDILQAVVLNAEIAHSYWGVDPVTVTGSDAPLPMTCAAKGTTRLTAATGPGRRFIGIVAASDSLAAAMALDAADKPMVTEPAPCEK